MGARSDYWVEESTPVSMADRTIRSPHDDGVVPDWLAAMPVAAAVLHVFDDNVTIQTCNAIFAECFQAKSQEWIGGKGDRSEEHTSELQSLMRISYAVFCLKKKN